MLIDLKIKLVVDYNRKFQPSSSISTDIHWKNGPKKQSMNAESIKQAHETKHN